MSIASYVSLVLVRFNSLHTVPSASRASQANALFHAIGADTNAAGKEFGSGQAFKFIIMGLHNRIEDTRPFLTSLYDMAPWVEDGAEHWEAVLEPSHHHGECNFLNQDEPGPMFRRTGKQPKQTEPIVVITSLGYKLNSAFDPNRVAAFSNNFNAVRSNMDSAEGLYSQQVFNFGDFSTDPITLTTWSDSHSMMSWAYKAGAHRHYLNKHRVENMFDRSSFTRCRILHERGTWYGKPSTQWHVA